MPDEVKFPFGPDFQKSVLALMMKDPVVMIRGSKYLKAEFFTLPSLAWIFGKIVWYFDMYSKVIDSTIFAEEIKKLSQAVQLEYLQAVKEVLSANTAQSEYVLEKIVEFVKRNEFVRAWQKTESLFTSGMLDESFDYIADAVAQIKAVTFIKEDRSFVFNEISDRQILRHLEESMPNNRHITTGIPVLDKLLGGSGPEKGEVMLVFGDAKKGKSIFLLHVGYAAARTHSGNILHIQLEGSRRQTENRYDSRFSEHPYDDVKLGEIPDPVYDRLLKEYKQLGSSLVVRSICDWQQTILSVEEEMKILASQNWKPDLVIIDYGDLLNPRRVSDEGSYADQTSVFRDIKTFAQKNDVLVWTASQATRPDGNKTEDPKYVLRARNLADCYGKARIVDGVMSLNQTVLEKARGTMRLYFEMYRDGEAGKIINLNTDFSRMTMFSQKSLVGG